MVKKSPLKFFLLSMLLIALDQAVKLLVHFNMEPGFAGQIRVVGDWLKLHYVLNPGMAFGMQLGHEYGKLLLSLFRLVAMAGIGWYLVHLAHRGAPNGLLWAMAMILAGAVGNVIDSTFYGVFLDNAPYGSATPWFHGQVIDMIFVDVWEGFLPDWVPLWGGQYYSTPIFNIADSCIFVGVCIILFFQRRFFREQSDEDGFLPDDPSPDTASVLPASEFDDSTPTDSADKDPDPVSTDEDPQVTQPRPRTSSDD
ncbi:hypothetical protein GCM10027299_20010 [Larkinella ripae]